MPVSDHDHGLNNIVFGNNGELYFAIGSNTNGGVPGKDATNNSERTVFRLLTNYGPQVRSLVLNYRERIFIQPQSMLHIWRILVSTGR